MLRIALGENRFQARRWREATTHLEGIAEHAMSSQYPEEVAQALTHAAQAELKLRRPERAAALHEAALRFSRSHPQTLRALADLAIERGDKLEAARSLRRVAESSADRNERVQIFEQIGDLQLALGNKDAARTAYVDAAAMLETVEPSAIRCWKSCSTCSAATAPSAMPSRPRDGSPRRSWTVTSGRAAGAKWRICRWRSANSPMRPKCWKRCWRTIPPTRWPFTDVHGLRTSRSRRGHLGRP